MNMPVLENQKHHETTTIVGSVNLTGVETKSSLSRMYFGIGDQMSVMSELYDLNDHLLQVYKTWATLSEANRPVKLSRTAVQRLITMNDLCRNAIASSGTAAFCIDQVFLDGKCARLTDEQDITTNHFFNSTVISLVRHTIAFDEQFAQILFSITDKELNQIRALSFSDIKELLSLNQMLPMHPIPAFKAKRSVRNRYQNKILVDQGKRISLALSD